MLLSGLAMSLGTPWGLFRHYWVVITLVLHLPTVSALADTARAADGAYLGGLGGIASTPAAACW
jgi:hypothetical protein